jgi:hypothetical protein
MAFRDARNEAIFDGEIVPRRTFELAAIPTSGHLLSDFTNSFCAYVPGRPFDTPASRFRMPQSVLFRSPTNRRREAS